MKLALAVTLVFVALTSLLGAQKNAALPRRPSRVAGAVIGLLMGAWCFWLSWWVWQHL